MKDRAGAYLGGKIDPVTQCVDHAPYDCEAQSQTARREVDVGGVQAAMKFLEDCHALLVRNSAASIDDIDPRHCPPGANADEHAAFLGVADRVRDDVLQYPPQQSAV